MPDDAATAPIDLLLVRHGQSVGNHAVSAVDRGDAAGLEILAGVPTEAWALTDRGRAQAERTGAFVNACFAGGLDFFYTSHFTRAQESALTMRLRNAGWRVAPAFGELDIGDRFAGLTDLATLHARVSNEREQEEADRLSHRPPNGETRLEVHDRVASALAALSERHAGRSGIVVCHGEVMWAARALIEGWDHQTWVEVQSVADRRTDAAVKSNDKILNGHLFWLTRRDPATGDVVADRQWFRRVCPEHPGTDTGWYEVPAQVAFRRPGAAEASFDGRPGAGPEGRSSGR